MSTLKVNSIQHSNGTDALTIDSTGHATFNKTLIPAESLTNKNLIINGNFDVWQRGTSHNITYSQYTVDRWQLIFDGTPATGGTITRQTFALGQTDVPNNPKYYLQYDFPNVGTPSNYIRQSIEGVHNLAGQEVTLSFWAKVPSGTMTISSQFQQEFGSGGSPSSGVYGIGSTNFTVTTSWQKFYYTTTLPSISGKTIGTDNKDKLNAAIIFPPNSAGTIHLAQVQVEAGNAVTPFEVLPYHVELRRCERYFQLVGQGNMGRSNGTVAEMAIAFRTTMRATPNVGWYDYPGLTNQLGQFGVGTITATGGSSGGYMNNTGGYFIVNGPVAAAGAITCIVHANMFSCTAEL